MNNQINDLRTALFNQLERLADPNCVLEKEMLRTEAIVDVAKVLVDSAKTEVEFMKATGTIGTGFIPSTTKMIGDGSK